MGNTRDLSNRINESYSRLSKGQKLLATYITDNYDKAVFLTAARLGEVVGVSESTVVRFATHLEESVSRKYWNRSCTRMRTRSIPRWRKSIRKHLRSQ